MFRRRLTWFWILLTAAALTLAVRLVDIQLVHAADYEEQAAALLTQPVRYLPAPRGSILDRHGRVLVSHEPSFDLCVHYAVLTGQSKSYLQSVARRLKARGEFPATARIDEITDTLRLRVGDMWRRLSELTGEPVAKLIERGERVRAQVARVRAEVRRRTGVDQPVREESDPLLALHPIAEDVDEQTALAARLELEAMPWVRLVPGSRRVARNADSVVHLLGRMGAVSQERLSDDPLAGDELRALHPGERCGLSGVERLAEPILRGTRGRIVEELDGTVIERLDPVPGRDVVLTIDTELQEYALELLGAAVEESTYKVGGAAVVLDVQTREILALVSYPVYRYSTFDEDYELLLRNAQQQPLRFRAVSGLYPPGSTCKAITLVGAIMDRKVDPDERIHCEGHLLPEQPNQFRCWIYNQYRTTHDAEMPGGQRGEDAIRNSCNIYFYKLGDRLGPGRLCEWFERFGLGSLQATGLIEESRGIVPSAAWLRAAQGREFERADAWNWSIGQGEVSATPLQVANVCATIAAGHWAPTRLIREPYAPNEVPAPSAPLDEAALRVLRTGMWRVVNEPGGTAYKHARLERRDTVFCGKTGSAQAAPLPVLYRYTFRWPDGRRAEYKAYLEDDARALALREHGGEPQRVGKYTIERYPALLEGESAAHAWFMGYTQSADTPRGNAPRGKSYAIAVIVEYGESGGSVAGPVAMKLAEYLLDRDGEHALTRPKAARP